MATLNCQVVYEGTLPGLANTTPGFNVLKHSRIIPGRGVHWTRDNQTSEDLQIVVMGKTGYGKSTLLNRLVGQQVFRTSDTASCTRRMESADFPFQHGEGESYFSLADLPGIGENPDQDREYIDLYRQVLSQANIVVYVLRADQRDYSVDEQAFRQLFPTREARDNVLVALNAVDKIEPLSRALPFELNEAQRLNLRYKIDNISRVLNLPESRIIPVSAEGGYGIPRLVMNMIGSISPLLTLVEPTPSTLANPRINRNWAW